MKKIVLVLLSLMIIASPAFAKPMIDVSVNGMVCDFCAQAIKKVLNENENVENVEISLDDALVVITMKDGTTLSDEEVEKAIVYAGYDLVKIERRESE